VPRTKIICTIGPATSSAERLRDLMRAGMDVARINFSHGTHAEHAEAIRRLRDVAGEEGRVLAILGDLQGPKIRIGRIRGGEVDLAEGAEILLTLREVPGSAAEVHLPHPELVDDLEPGQRLLLDDGNLELAVLQKSSDGLRCRIVDGGRLRSRKGVAVPGAPLSISALTAKDREDARFAVEQGLDFIALSFVRSGRDVEALRDWLTSLGSKMPIVAKIEKPEALVHIDEILSRVQGVMIARGDLGVETPPEHVPFTQKDLIRRCLDAALPVITATQMLESMIENPRPTRAEASDVANAILDGTSAVMLSAETAIGKHPVQAVEMMARVAEYTESKIPYDEWTYSARRYRARDSAEAICEATVEMAAELGAKAIVTSSYLGLSPRLVSRHRPRTPVLAMTPNPDVHRQMALLWGVTPVLVPYYETTDQLIATASRVALESGLAQVGDTIIITAGIPPMAGQKTNMVDVYVIPS
jgi:pyruvate kinase